MKISSITTALIMFLMVLALNACGDGKSDSGGAQERAVQCAANQILNNGQCQTCPANQSVVGNQCVLQCAANQFIQNGQCVSSASQCTGNQIAQNGGCVSCLEAQVPNAERTMCVDNRGRCQSNEIEQNGLCMACPAGQFASGNRCASPPVVPVSCGANQIVQNNTCVNCAATEMVVSNMCVPIPVTCTATQIVVSNMCVDCPVGDVVQSNTCITPIPNNDAPVVTAGADQTIQLPVNMVSLAGSATDDGNPNPPGTLTYSWTGPVGVSFANATNPNTTATFSAAGSYELTLSVSDSNLIGMADVIIIVNPDIPAQNVTPIVTASATSATSVTLPENSVNVTGTASDADNQPAGLTTNWSGASFGDASALTTVATLPNQNAGNYTLMLSAFDGAATAIATVDVTVLLPSCPNNSVINLPFVGIGSCTCSTRADVIDDNATGTACLSFVSNTQHTNGGVTAGSTCSTCHSVTVFPN